jgi:hypothetical protein
VQADASEARRVVLDGFTIMVVYFWDFLGVNFSCVICCEWLLMLPAIIFTGDEETQNLPHTTVMRFCKRRRFENDAKARNEFVYNRLSVCGSVNLRDF